MKLNILKKKLSFRSFIVASFLLLTLMSSCASKGDTVGDDTVSVAIDTESGHYSDEQLIDRAIEFEPAFRALIFSIKHLNKKNGTTLGYRPSDPEFVSVALSSLLNFKGADRTLSKTELEKNLRTLFYYGWTNPDNWESDTLTLPELEINYIPQIVITDVIEDETDTDGESKYIAYVNVMEINDDAETVVSDIYTFNIKDDPAYGFCIVSCIKMSIGA